MCRMATAPRSLSSKWTITSAWTIACSASATCRTRQLAGFAERNLLEASLSPLSMNYFMFMRTHLALIVIFVLLGASCSFSQSSPTQNGPGLPVRIHGFLLGNYAVRTSDEHPASGEGGRFLWADERLRVELSGDTAKGNLSFLFKGDLFHDAVANKMDGIVSEGYLDYSRPRFDLRLGRQIVTWGVGDLLFINDVFPKDWSAFFSGRPLEYLKVGVDAAKLHVATPALNAELVVIPFFRPDELPGSERF